ncbi:ATP-binding protein [Arthrobacter sp. 2YAF22_2]|uniref:GAF domain-containing sensor histidine kinase n=1 Tax=Arthrobacter sp. 2YAF22_2 TaxID=3233029 RepID=UPI003F8FF1EA
MLAGYGLPRLEPLPENSGARVPDTMGQLRKLLVLATTTTGIPFGVVNIITADQQHHIAAVGIDPGMCSREDSMCSRVFLSGRTTVVPDASRDPMFRDHPFVTGKLAAVRFYASVPLTTTDGFVLGSLCLFSHAPAELSAERTLALEIIASQVVEVLELQHHARMLDRALEEARTSNKLLESFAGRISHDLRNPLTSIIGFTELGELRSSADAEELGIIGRTSRRMLAMVDDILSFSRIGGALRCGDVSLLALVRDVEEDLRSSLSEVDADIEVSDFVLRADAEQLRMLLQNLIHNAVTYRCPGLRPRILVRAEAIADGVEIQVADNGKGIPMADWERVTQPLVRLHREDDPPGSGLGLATCLRIANAHGGSLWISSGPDGGTVVSVRLPASPVGPYG